MQIRRRREHRIYTIEVYREDGTLESSNNVCEHVLARDILSNMRIVRQDRSMIHDIFDDIENPIKDCRIKIDDGHLKIFPKSS